MQQTLDLSVVMPFADDEEVIGSAVRRVAVHVREHGLEFELVAVDEDSGDNSHAVLALLRTEIPELRIGNASGRGRGFAAGVRRARGRALWLVEPRAAMAPLSPFGRAYRHVTAADFDAVVVEHRFVVCHRTHTLPVIEGLKGGGIGFQRRLAKRAEARQLAVETQVIGGAAPNRSVLGDGSFARLLGAIAPARLGFNFRSERTLW